MSSTGELATYGYIRENCDDQMIPIEIVDFVTLFYDLWFHIILERNFNKRIPDSDDRIEAIMYAEPGSDFERKLFVIDGIEFVHMIRVGYKDIRYGVFLSYIPSNIQCVEATIICCLETEHVATNQKKGKKIESNIKLNHWILSIDIPHLALLCLDELRFSCLIDIESIKYDSD